MNNTNNTTRDELITVTELARRRGKSYTWIRQKLKKGGFKKEGGKVNYLAACQFLDEHTQTKYRPYKSDGATPELRESQRRKEAAVARLKELEVAEKEGRLIDFEEAKKEFFRIGRAVRDNLLALEDRLAGPLAAENDPRVIKGMIHQDVMTILRDLDKPAF